MNGSESSKSSSRATESASRSWPQTMSTDSTNPPPSSSAAPANNSTAVNYSTLDPFILMNTSGNNAVFPGQLPNPPHAVNPSVIPGNNSFAGFRTTQPLPQYQQQLIMWPFIPQQPFASNEPLAGGPTAFVNSQPPVHSYPPTAAGPSRPTLHHISPASSAPQIHSPTSSAQEQSPVDPEEAAVTEDKRRRNTAASARFRIKKKQKNLNLERTVSDLSSRAEELEREATNLRRENSWLKEMVMMKGRRNLVGSGRSREEGSSDSEGNDRDDDAEGSDTEHVQRKRKLSKAKINGKRKAQG